MRRRLRLGALGLATLSGFAAAASAQAPAPAPPMLRGVVVDTAGVPLPDVHVQRKGKRGVLSGIDGRFALPIEPNEKLQIELRRVGLFPTRFLAATAPDTAVTLVMYPMPQMLPGVDVKAKRSINLERVGFYGRLSDNQKGASTGYFLTPEYLEKRNGMRVTQLLENVPGIRASAGLGGSDSPILTGANNCFMNIWLNGINLAPDSSGVPSQRTRAAWMQARGGHAGGGSQAPISHPLNIQIDRMIQGSAVAAIEVYPRLLQVPERFRTLHSDCGAVVIWLKAPGDP